MAFHQHIFRARTVRGLLIANAQVYIGPRQNGALLSLWAFELDVLYKRMGYAGTVRKLFQIPAIHHGFAKCEGELMGSRSC